MKILIALISSNAEIYNKFKLLRTSLIPRDLIVRGPLGFPNPTYIIKSFNPELTETSVEDYLRTSTADVDAIILLVESHLLTEIDRIRAACFVAPLIFDRREINLRNYFGPVFARVFKNFSAVWNIMSSSDNEQVMILPIRNFNSQSLRNLVHTCSVESMDPALNNILGGYLTELRKNKRPRRNTRDKTIYIVDDDEKYFEYGKERHARLPTGAPHNSACEINGNFRFGKRIANDRHFNVTKLSRNHTKIKGSFPNCHDELIDIKETTHINMFSNDGF